MTDKASSSHCSVPQGRTRAGNPECQKESRLLIHQHLNKFLTGELPLFHYRKESSNREDLPFWDNYQKFLTCIILMNKSSMTSFSLVTCIGKSSLFQS